MREPKGEKTRGGRMSELERRSQLERIMYALFVSAKVQKDFTAKLIAAEAGVSEVYVYNIIGEEFKQLRAKLPGPRRSPDTVLAELRQKLTDWERQFRELKDKYEEAIKMDIGEMIITLERYDAGERRLMSIIEMLIDRLRRCGQKVELSDILGEKKALFEPDAKGKKRAA